jgi:hypothetical protein
MSDSSALAVSQSDSPTAIARTSWRDQAVAAWRSFREESRDGLPALVYPCVVVGFVLAMMLGRAVWGVARIPQAYDEPITGYMAWFDLGKARDFLGLATWLVGLVLFPTGLYLGCRQFVLGTKHGVEQSVRTLLWCTLIPTMWWLGSAWMRTDFHNGLVPHDSAIAMAALVWALAALKPLRRELTGPATILLAGGAVLLSFLGQFAGLGLETLAVKLVPALVPKLTKWIAVGPIVGAAVAFLGAVHTFKQPTVELATRKLVRWALLVQVPLLGLAWIIIPADVMFQGQALPARHYWTLHLLPLSLAIWGLVSVVRLSRLREEHRPGGLDALLSTPCLVAVLVFMTYIPQGSRMLHPDHFHHGEQLLPYQQCVTLGQTPYVDYLPIHGLMPLSRGFLNAMFYDGTTVGFSESVLLLALLATVTQFVAVAALAGPGVALLTGVPFLHLMDRFYFFLPAILLLANPSLRSRPIAWLWCWLGAAVTLLAFNPCVGTAFDAGTLPVALAMAWGAWMSHRTAFVRSVGALVVGGALLAATTPAVEIVVGFVEFIRINGAVSNPAHGIPWGSGIEMTEITPPAHIISAPMFQVLRLSWIGSVVLVGLFALQEALRGKRGRSEVVWMVGLAIPSILVMIPWTMGRIDPGGMSRSGWLSILLLMSFVPVVALMVRGPQTAGGFALGVSLVAGMFSWPGFGPALHRHVAKPVTPDLIRVDHVLVDGPREGLPGLGLITMSAEHRDREFAFRDAINQYVRPEETYFDFSNTHARYAYLGKRAPALYTSVFHTASRAMQQQTWNQLARDLPPVVVLGPGETFGSGPVSLRAFGLYREFALRYVAKEVDGVGLLVRPDRVPPEERPTRAEQTALWMKYQPLGDLSKLPQAWGRSWSRMEDEFQLTAQPAVRTGAACTYCDQTGLGKITFPLNGLDLSGADVDYLKLELAAERKPGSDGRLSLSWQADGVPCPAPIVMCSKPGTLLIPVGAASAWLLSTRLESLTFTLEIPEANQWEIRNLTLLSRKPLSLPADAGPIPDQQFPKVPSVAPPSEPHSVPALAKEPQPADRGTR